MKRLLSAKRLAATALLVTAMAASAQAAPTQDDIFRSIQQNVETSNGDASRYVPFILAVVAGVIVIAVVAQRRSDKPVRKTFNHAGKLLKEVTRHLPIRPVEMKQLKLLVDGAKNSEEPIASPLALMLCPSQLTKLAKQGGAKQDRRAIVSLLRKLGVG